MLRELGIDNCSSCKFNLKAGNRRFCSRYKLFLKVGFGNIDLKPDICNMPFKGDLSDDNDDLTNESENS